MRLKAFIPALIVLAVLTGQRAWALGPDDGFIAAKKIDGRYLSVELAPGVDQLSLLQSLNISAQDKILAGQYPGNPQFAFNSLPDLLDALFLWSSNILDMQLLTYHGKVKVVRDAAELDAIYSRLFGIEHPGEKAFYVYEVNTVYVIAQEFTKEIVGHEVAHAIISNFFVVQPPMKVQEVLAGYIEYQLRKNPSP